MLLSTFNETPSDEINSNCFKPACGGKVAHLKMTLPQKYSPRNKTPYPYLMNLLSNYLDKNIISNTAKINGIQIIQIKNVVEIRDQNRCILFGPPRIAVILGVISRFLG